MIKMVWANRFAKPGVRFFSLWDNIPAAEPDKIFGVMEAFNQNKSPHKVLLGAGAYRDHNGQPFILECVRSAEKQLFASHSNHEYGDIYGSDSFNDKCL